ncbi:reverse transcriptase domain, reverse transcriptase zinc-binding domain protein [Tanacetum coccineum]
MRRFKTIIQAIQLSCLPSQKILTLDSLSSSSANEIKGDCQGGLDWEGDGFVSPWLVNRKPLVVQKWDPDMNIIKSEPKSIPMWVKMYNVPLEAWNVKGIRSIASRVGKPVMMHQVTVNICHSGVARLGYARVLVEIDAKKGAAQKSSSYHRMEVFVSAKSLVAGDSVLFICDSIHIGLLAAAAHAAATNSCFAIFYNPRSNVSSKMRLVPTIRLVIMFDKVARGLVGTSAYQLCDKHESKLDSFQVEFNRIHGNRYAFKVSIDSYESNKSKKLLPLFSIQKLSDDPDIIKHSFQRYHHERIIGHLRTDYKLLKSTSISPLDKNPERAIRDAYRSTDKNILENAMQLGPGGSTAVTAIVIDGRDLWVANIGDSRAVLCERGSLQSAYHVMSNLEAIEMVKSIKDPLAAAKRLTSEALARKSKDDISCIVIRFI